MDASGRRPLGSGCVASSQWQRTECEVRLQVTVSVSHLCSLSVPWMYQELQVCNVTECLLDRGRGWATHTQTHRHTHTLTDCRSDFVLVIDTVDSQWAQVIELWCENKRQSFWMSVLRRLNYICSPALSLQLPSCIIQAETLECILYDGVLAAQSELTQNWGGEEERKRHVFTRGKKKSRRVDSV